MITGSKQKVTFETNAPDGGQVYANFDYVGNTDTEFKLKRSDIPKMYTITAEGCKDTSFVIPQKFNHAVWADVLFPYAIIFDYAYDVQQKTDKVIKIDLDCSDSTNVDNVDYD